MSHTRHRGPTSPPAIQPWDGILLVDKPSGPTSHDIVAKVRRAFGFKKVGHGGTLDPMATGLLVLLIGKGTKLSEELIRSDKTYEGTMTLGIATSTQDVEGEVLEEMDASAITRDMIDEQVKKWQGDVQQVPPMVSAIKRDGVPLYKLARKGKTVEREPRLIHIYEFVVLEEDLPRISFRLRCTKGTYVRTICADIGEALGCGAHLSRLRRTRSGAFSLDEALTLDEILACTKEELVKKIVPIHRFRARDVRT